MKLKLRTIPNDVGYDLLVEAEKEYTKTQKLGNILADIIDFLVLMIISIFSAFLFIYWSIYYKIKNKIFGGDEWEEPERKEWNDLSE